MDDGGRLPFMGRRPSSDFALRQVLVVPGSEYAYDESEWDDALVVVERGTIELECRDGTRRSFIRGDVLFLSGLPLRVLRNRGLEPVVLISVARRHRYPLTARARAHTRVPGGDR
jgi:hypothetical protein